MRPRSTAGSGRSTGRRRPPRSIARCARFDPAPGATASLGAAPRQCLARGSRVAARRTRCRGPSSPSSASGIDVACGATRCCAPSNCSPRADADDGGAFAAGRAVVPGARFDAWPANESRFDARSSRCRQRARSRACSAACALREALAAVDDGTALRGRALVQELAYGTLRHWGTLDAIAGALVRKPIADPLLRSLVAVALYQLDHTRAPAFAVVDRAVYAAGALVRPGAKALVNALLAALPARAQTRRTRRTRRPSRAGPIRAGGSSGVRRDHPECWESVLAAGNARPPLTLRVNFCVTDRESLLQQFAAAGIGAHAGGRCRHDRRSAAARDRAARIRRRRVRRAGPRRATGRTAARCSDGMRVLDACAAPGGKTAHLLEPADIDVVALDVDAERLLARPRQPGAPSACRPACRRRPRRCGRAARLVGRRAVRPDPARRSLHGIGRRSPASRRQMAASGVRRGALRARAGAPRGAHGRCWRRAASFSMRPARSSRPKMSAVSREFLARHPDALRETLTFPPDAAHGAANSCLRLPARATIRTGFSTRGSEALMWPLRATTRPRSRSDTPSRHRRTLRVPPACRSILAPPIAAAPLAAGAKRCACCWRRCSRSRRRRAARRHHPASVGGTAHRRRRRAAEGRIRVRAHADARGGAGKRHPAVFHDRIRARRARAGTGSTRKSPSRRSPIASRTTRSRASTACRADRSAQTFESLDEVQRFIGRVTSRPVARADALAKGARYEAAVR